MASLSSFTVTITSAADDQEVAYLSRARILHRIRIGITLLLLGASAGVVGTEGAPLHYYNETKAYSSAWLPLWPLNLDVRQTNALLACGVVILFQSIVYIIVAAFPSPRPRLRLLNLLSTAVGATGLVTAIVGVAFSIYLPSATYPEGFTVSETIHSWTCKWKSIDSISGGNNQTLSAPANFSRVCAESRAGFVLSGLLIGLEIFMCAAAAAGYMLDMNVSRQRKSSNADEFHVMEPKQ
ncbi:conserved hypothetical protein [Talaromyces stipitatus ATCC 10500]|uniref:MARVEL domain-containing protein n=1 Tax=Talaromyces stipitatus (strain ATCC 10500 / CBS 375.48 / QM 6759 / NRRL 1006) TaxID=441959 RepID=B8M3E3_TALSN|nr:uncharacterized protein TSTA_095640 [Talaromyces stipitatus ATCC 10500]EED22315.1 conserved hypothetical protein [Talaromyces stipitatus ATCC 10500]